MIAPSVRGALSLREAEMTGEVVLNSSVCEMAGEMVVMSSGMSILRARFCSLLSDTTCRRRHRIGKAKSQLSPGEAVVVVEQGKRAHTRSSSLF